MDRLIHLKKVHFEQLHSATPALKYTCRPVRRGQLGTKRERKDHKECQIGFLPSHKPFHIGIDFTRRSERRPINCFSSSCALHRNKPQDPITNGVFSCPDSHYLIGVPALRA